MSNRDKFISSGLMATADYVRSYVNDRRIGKQINDKHDIISTQMAGVTSSLLGIMYDELHPTVELKVLRTEEAKQFPLIGIAKDGDVGYDLYSVFPLKEDHEEIAAYYRKTCHDNGRDVDDYSLNHITHESVTIYPGQRGVIPTGIRLEIPTGYWASIEARSSTSKAMIDVPKGVIDEGYRGELFAVLLNVGDKPVTIGHGERWVQLILHKRMSERVKIVETDEISPSKRGETGFGSSGR